MSELPSWARLGTRVICIDAAPIPGKLWTDGDEPVLGQTYTVSSVFVGPDGHWAFQLIELKRGPSAIRVYGPQVGYRVARFRPAVSDDNEIETVLYRKRNDKLHQRVSTKSRERA